MSGNVLYRCILVVFLTEGSFLGKPYLSELQQLGDTYASVMQMDISPLISAFTPALGMPLFSVGSGGALSAAHFTSVLHQRFAGRMAKAITPLEVLHIVSDSNHTEILNKSAFLCLSASGRNIDITRAFQMLSENEPSFLAGLCAKKRSPLSEIADGFRTSLLYEFEIPSGKDGFLATNSLLAFITLMSRVYQETFLSETPLPSSLLEILSDFSDLEEFISHLKEVCSFDFLRRDNFVVLYSAMTEAAAYDLESKFTEAALGSVLLSDYRNFAHGRHHWFAKRGDNTSIIALSTPNEKEIANKTIQSLPDSIPRVQFVFNGDPITMSISAMVTAFHIVHLVGENRGIDPGRPGVPEFGRRIYHLRTNVQKGKKKSAPYDNIVMRKYRIGKSLTPDFLYWGKAFRMFSKRIKDSTFAAVVFDYDGTLCGPENRFGNLDIQIVNEISRIVSAGIPIGIATGRGKSVRKSLRDSFPPNICERIVIGYYNGAECGLATDDQIPDNTSIPCSQLKTVAGLLLKNTLLASFSEITVRKHQITVEPKPFVSFDSALAYVNQIVCRYANQGIKVLRSDHSIDIISPKVSKLNVIEYMRHEYSIDASKHVLCIGDQGIWPGNDCVLLQEPYSLSVDKVSADPLSCWNIAPMGHRGVSATLCYLKSFRLFNKEFNIDIDNIVDINLANRKPK